MMHIWLQYIWENKTNACVIFLYGCSVAVLPATYSSLNGGAFTECQQGKGSYYLQT